MNIDTIIGRWFRYKVRKRLKKVSVFKVALQLRKWGIPLSVARVIILGAIAVVG